MRRYLVAALLQPLAVGDEFPASRWPLHVTLSTNFDLDESAAAAEEDAVLAAVSRVAAAIAPITVTAEEDAWFGSRHTTRVNPLQPREELTRLHDGLVSALTDVGARFLYPEHLGSGYRPHATVQRSARLRAGDVRLIDRVALIDRAPAGDRRLRRVVAELPLTGGD